MSDVKSILQALVPPLRYAARDAFAHLHTLKGFEALVSEAGKRAAGAGLRAEQARRLGDDVRGFEAMDRRAREVAIRALVRDLSGLVELPSELAALDGDAEPEPGPQTVHPERSEAESRGVPRQARDERRQARDERRFASEADLVAYAAAPPRVPVLHVESGPLATPLKELGRIHPRLQALLTRKSLRRAGDVLFLMPRTYEDRRRISTLAELRPGERGSALVEVRLLDEVRVRGGRKNLRVLFGDLTGTVAGVFFHYGPWLKGRFQVGKRLLISGELRATPHGREMAHPEAEPADDWPSSGDAGSGASSIHFGRIVPVYPGFDRGEQRSFRELSHRVAERLAGQLDDPLPGEIRGRIGLPHLREALAQIHFPDEGVALAQLQAWSSPYHRRLAFDELFFLQLGLALRRQGVKVEPGIRFRADAEVVGRATARLPFALTAAQRRTLGEIAADMSRPEPMNRLLQGDVGSGKTAVALCACLVAIENAHQAAVMAPTEILAEQHARTLQALVKGAGIEVGLFTAAKGAKRRRQLREQLASGEVHLAVGTHALLEEEVVFGRLGLVVIDEQHRFGVMQRALLRAKGARPDVLVMTATPIPRTLAMAAYGDLDLSVIDELPPGRTPVETRVFDERRRVQVYQLMACELAKGRQAYVVYPLVEESEKLDLQSATLGAQNIQATFPDCKVGLLHGRMKAAEKEQVMGAFRAGALHILVATSVVEVGVDVPNATVMLVEDATRFGLSQLHQLRGRVGRSHHASRCYLIASHARSELASERLEIMARSSDGFVIAQKDLELRGPGEFLGTRQSGLPELAVANLARDQDLLALARREAMAIAQADPTLSKPEHRGLAQALRERWEGKLGLAKIG